MDYLNLLNKMIQDLQDEVTEGYYLMPAKHQVNKDTNTVTITLVEVKTGDPANIKRQFKTVVPYSIVGNDDNNMANGQS